MSAWRLKADMAAILEGRCVSRKDWFLANHSPTANCLQSPRQGENAPVTLSQLHGLGTKVLQADTVAPLKRKVYILIALVAQSNYDIMASFISVCPRTTFAVKSMKWGYTIKSRNIFYYIFMFQYMPCHARLRQEIADERQNCMGQITEK